MGISFIDNAFERWQKMFHHQANGSRQKSVKNGNNSEVEDNEGGWRWLAKIHSPVMIIVSVSALTSITSYRFYNQPELAVGTISPVTIVSPRDGTFIDHKTTEELRKKIKQGTLPVLNRDYEITASLQRNLSNTLQQIESLRKRQQAFNSISPSSLVRLYSMPEDKWQSLREKLLSPSLSPPAEEKDKAVLELWNYRSRVDTKTFQGIVAGLESARREYQSLRQLKQSHSMPWSREEVNSLLTLDEASWQKLKQGVLKIQQLMLLQGIPSGLPDYIKREVILLHLESSQIPTQQLAVKLLLPHLTPNLTIDKEKTIDRAEKAAEEVETVVISIRKGDIIVAAGEKITQTDFVILDGLGLSRRGVNWHGIAVSSLLVSASVIVFEFVTRKIQKKLRRRDQILFLLLSLCVLSSSIFDAQYNPLPAVGFLSSTFYGTTLALTQVSLITGLTLFQTEVSQWPYIISSFAGAVVASIVASRLYSREELALLGVGVGMAQGTVYFIISLAQGASGGSIWYALLPTSSWHGLVGLAYTIVSLGVSPYLERFFDLITPIRLAELSNPNRPLLKRLAIEAPGTFQHTLFVASLAEAAARRLHCNVELVRAGTLYHDIGKMHDPLAFIENQMGGINKHDIINDPWKSAEIIKKHVTEGIIMAKKAGLPKAIRDFIPEHQGTLLISYFYYQAKNLQKENPSLVVNEADFRYDGPIPQSRETAIVMLADSCEAALRSLKNATPEQARAMIHKIFQARWRDHQLDDSGIKYEELPIIAEVFVEVWQQFNHQRIPYPKAALDLQPTSPSP